MVLITTKTTKGQYLKSYYVYVLVMSSVAVALIFDVVSPSKYGYYSFVVFASQRTSKYKYYSFVVFASQSSSHLTPASTLLTT